MPWGKRSLLPSATKLRRLCCYRCLSVHRGEGVSGRGGLLPGGCLVQGGMSSWGGGAWSGGLVSQHALRQTPLGEMATAADGTHPTGMHSCFKWKKAIHSHVCVVIVSHD